MSDSEFLQRLQDFNREIQDFIPESRIDYWSPITFHIVRDNAGMGGLPYSRILQGLQDMNEAYQNAGIQFYQAGEIDYIDDSAFYSDIDTMEEINALRNTNVVPNTINIYSTSGLSSGDTDLCGISSFTFSQTQGIVMANSCFATQDNHSTLAHEVGHYFDLYHTHQGSNDHDGDGIIDGDSAEFVDFTECESRGDGLCDTPADPNLSEIVSGSCNYLGDYLDGHLEPYDPDTQNLMSYSTKSCRDHFSMLQDNKIIYTLVNYRPELNVPPTVPNLLLISTDSSEIAGDADGILNPGESAAFIFSLVNRDGWPDAHNIIVELSSEHPSVEIIEGIFEMNELASGDTLNNGGSPFHVTIDPLAGLGAFPLGLDIIATGLNDELYQVSYSVSINVSIHQAGWPADTLSAALANIEVSPLVVDISGDNALEILFADYNGILYKTDIAGNEIVDELFPFDTGNQVWGSPAAADIDNDGFIEIVVTSKSKHLYILDTVDQIVQADYDTGQFLMGSPSLGNLDDDSDLEIIFGGYNSSGKIYAINPDGSDVPGFPITLGEKILRGISIADINGNGRVDMVCATEENALWLIYDDTTVAPGFPYLAGDKFKTAPTLLDTGGGFLILAGNRDNYLHAVSSTGEAVFIVETGGYVNTSPGMAEAGGDIYIFFGSDDGYLYAIDLNGQLFPGWPVDTGSAINSSPVFADMDNDGSPEVISGNTSGQVLVYHLDGSPFFQFPLQLETQILGTPVIADIDGDDDLEILVGTAGKLVCLDVKSPGDSSGYWNRHRGNYKRTGTFVIESGWECPNPQKGDVNCDSFIDILDIVRAVNIVLDPLNPGITEFEYWSADFNDDQIIDILDIVSIVNTIVG